ncbi:MAG: hypothetical protein IIC91_06975 [Chloroflexi bacterium]|nr:hypothetical protein [Chloroflexota bacterium]
MAAYLKFVAISIIAAALLAAACADGGDEVAPLPSSTLPPPTTTPRQAASTPTPIPDGMVSPASTPGWLTYTSPFGYSLDFPEDWTLETISGNQTKIMNPAYKEAIDDAIAAGHEGTGLPPTAGISQFSVIPDISPGFDVDHLIGSCEHGAQRGTFLDRAAVRCWGTTPVGETLTSAGRSYWVEFPPGHTMLVGGSMISEGAPDLAVIDAILNSFRFTPSP